MQQKANAEHPNASNESPFVLAIERFARFAEIEKKLTMLLRDFGPHRSSYHPEFPFWHMQCDGIWEIPCVEQLGQEKGFSRICRGLFLQNDASGGFPSDVYDALKKDQKLVRDIAASILAAHVPDVVSR